MAGERRGNGTPAGYTLAPGGPGMAARGTVKDLDGGADSFPTDVPLPAVIGSVVWMMSLTPTHKYLHIADIEWALLPPVGFGQFRLWRQNRAPIGYCAWAKVTEEVEDTMKAGGYRLAPHHWRCGERILLMEALIPVPLRERLLAELKSEVFAGSTVRMFQVGPDGQRMFVEW